MEDVRAHLISDAGWYEENEARDTVKQCALQERDNNQNRDELWIISKSWIKLDQL